MRHWLVAFLFMVVFSFSAVVNAGDDKKDSEAVKTMKEVVVTATRTEQSIERIPANVTVIDSDYIKNSNAHSVVDLLRHEEGVVVRDLLGHGKTSQVDLRGFGETGAYNTLVLVDGRRVNEVDLSGTDWTQIPLEQIERIEIVRGTGTVLYGDNAVGGVINIITKMPAEGFRFSAGSTLGSYGRNKEKIYLSGGSGRIAASIFSSYDSTNGYRDNGDFRTKDVGAKIVFDPTDFLSLNLSGSYHRDDYKLPGPLTEAQYAVDRRANVNPLDNGYSEDYYLKTGFDLELGRYGNIITDFSFRDRSSDSWFPDPTGVFPQGSDVNTETRSITPRYTWSGKILNHANSFIAGVDLFWSDQDIKSFGGFFVPMTTKTGTADIERDSLGFYFNNEFSILENLVLSTGARREKVRYDLRQRDLSAFPLAPLDTSISERENAYEIGLIYLYGDKSSLFARANRSLRFPLTDEVVYINWVTWKILANTDLEPQKGKHYELGVKHYFSPQLRFNITLFRAEIDDELFYNPLTFSNENHPETLHQGIEIGAKAQLLGWLTIFGNYTYEKAEFERNPYKNNEIPAVPDHRGNLGLLIHDVIPGLVFSADYNYVGSSYAISDQANNFKKLENHYVINLRASYEWRMFKAFAGVNNVTNQEYSEYAVMDTFLTTRNFYPSPERNWVAGLEISLPLR